MLVENLLKLALLGSTWVMYLLLILSVFSIGAIAERWWFFRRGSRGVDELRDRLAQLVARRDVAGARALLSSSPSTEARVLAPALDMLAGGPGALADAIDSELGRRRKELERGMNFLGTVGSNAPFIGLFGTVIGVIEAFAHLGAGQNDAAMANVMAGIAEALVATGVGLFVAIPAVVGFNWFQKKISSVEDNLGSISKQLSAVLQTHPARMSDEPRSPSVAAA
ncbi:MotA/TolQ/ExbB proton channel family protein [Vulgatibacter incomptus]|uniref:MotA/TolQ/ExbB proton channel family protein n=1 Tax=Vulgatibacter incomptus TaxID=1391653 RepID=A0A0K1PG61_9BACT|nr:MotA/TolQ/ExbB proton channel family protein [Vulgatibacter incomptus]AKU92099.1 MotA/TolQ/ExbB proton channel family protein [Vulgatibacter incomptus]